MTRDPSSVRPRSTGEFHASSFVRTSGHDGTVAGVVEAAVAQAERWHHRRYGTMLAPVLLDFPAGTALGRTCDLRPRREDHGAQFTPRLRGFCASWNETVGPAGSPAFTVRGAKGKWSLDLHVVSDDWAIVMVADPVFASMSHGTVRGRSQGTVPDVKGHPSWPDDWRQWPHYPDQPGRAKGGVLVTHEGGHGDVCLNRIEWEAHGSRKVVALQGGNTLGNTVRVTGSSCDVLIDCLEAPHGLGNAGQETTVEAVNGTGVRVLAQFDRHAVDVRSLIGEHVGTVFSIGHPVDAGDVNNVVASVGFLSVRAWEGHKFPCPWRGMALGVPLWINTCGAAEHVASVYVDRPVPSSAFRRSVTVPAHVWDIRWPDLPNVKLAAQQPSR